MGVPGQNLRGFVGQSMSGTRTFPGYDRTFTASPTAYSWTVPVSGYYEIAGWGCGSVTLSGVNGTGAFALRRLMLSAGQRLTIQVGLNSANVNPGSGATGTATDTVVTFPDGSTMTAGSAAAGVSAGTATGGDINVAGTAGTISAIAGPSYVSPYRTYTGGGVSGNKGSTPGGATGNAVTTYGSDGLVVVARIG